MQSAMQQQKPIEATTRLYGIIGHPVTHSLSPLFQNSFLHNHAINGCYVAFPTPPDGLEQSLRGLWASGIMGLNITVPHKERALELVQPDMHAQAIGAVNTLLRDDHGWQATNTDWIGLRQVMEALSPNRTPQSVLLFGAGGTARALLHACHALQVPRLTICNRTVARAEALAEHAAQQGYGMEIDLIPWQQAAVAAASLEHDTLINTTALGLHGAPPFPFSFPSAASGDQKKPSIAIDAVYQADGNTSFVMAARQQQRICTDGLPMLIAQGTASFYYWHALSIDRQQTLDAVCQHLHRTLYHMYGWEKNR